MKAVACASSIALASEKSRWASVPLGEIIEILDSQRKPITKRDRVAGPYPYFGATGVLDWVDGFIFDEPLVLIGEDGAKWGAGENSAFPISGKTWVNNHAHVMRPVRKRVLDDWLIYFLNAADLSEFVSGMTVPKLNQGRLREIPIPLPPLDEQKRIVAILDQAFAALDRARALAEANLVDARALFDNTLSEIFSFHRPGWVEAAIGDCIRFIDYRGRTPDKTISGLRLITAKNVKKGYLQDEPREFVAEDSYDGWMTRGIPEQGDVLFTTEAPLGNVAQLNTSDKVVFAQRVIIMQTDRAQLDSTFLKYMLLSSPVQKRIHAKATGATALGIKASLLKTIRISFPENIAEQCDIVGKINMLQDETKRLEVLYAGKLTDLANLRQSLLQKAFSGQLT